MNNTLKVSKYLFHDFKSALMIFYGIILSIAVFMAILYLELAGKGDTDMRFGGFSFASLIFIAISGLNCFKANFKFLQANNVSRKRFFFGNIITLAAVSALMALIDVAMTNVLKLVLPYQSMYEQIYNNTNLISDFLWSFTLYASAASTGWLITTLYYKCDKLMQTVISLAPVVVVILFIIINNYLYGALAKVLGIFITIALGLNNGNSYMAVLSFCIATICSIILCYPLVKKMAIKD